MLLIPRREIIQNVLLITPNPQTDGPGSCFAYSAGGFIYLITASHVIKSLPHAVEGKLYIYTQNKWKEIKVTPYFSSDRSYINGDIDIAVIKTSIQAAPNIEVELSCENSVLGQDVYFLGFPYFGNRIIPYLADPINNGKPLPLVKKATLSSLPRTEYPYFFLDGHNNPGFSGGPITFWDSKSTKQKVLGVVSSYLLHPGEIKQIEAVSPNLSYQENSGLAIAYNIRYAKDIIDRLSS